jgi:hypothetical protein
LCTRQPLRPQEVKRMSDWAHTALSIPLRYAQSGHSLAWAALAGAPAFEEMRHYPERDVVDRKHRTRFYYHAHDSHRWQDTEHGHFHLFVDDAEAGSFLHLAALSIDALGQPQRWFTTNRWVTGERWRPAEHMWPAIRAFRVHTHGRLAPVAQWLTAMVQLFADDLAQLHHERDARLAPWLAQASPDAVLEDRRLDVLSHGPAALAPQLARLGLL